MSTAVALIPPRWIAFAALTAFAVPPLGLRALGRGGTVFLVELLVLAAIPVLVILRGFRLDPPRAATALGLYLLACLPSYAAATDPARWVWGMSMFTVALAIVWCIHALPCPVRLLDVIVRNLWWPFAVLALVIIGKQAWTGELWNAGRQKIELAAGGSNFLASTLLLGVFVPLSAALVADRRAAPRLFAAYGVIAVGILLTGSRLGMLLLVVGTLATVGLVLRQHGSRRARGRLLGLGCVLLVVALIVTPYLSSLSAQGRFDNLLEQRNLLARFALFDVYVQLFNDSPWIGNGVLNGRLTPEMVLLGEGQGEGWGANQKAHNWILQCLGDTGVVGLAGFLVLLVAAGNSFLRLARETRNPWRSVSAGILAGFVVVTLHGLLEPNFHGKLFLYMFALLLGVSERIRTLVERAAPRAA